MRNKTKFNWACAHCNRRNLETFNFQFDAPKIYSCILFCSKCNKETKMDLAFSTSKIFEEKDEE